MGLDTSHNCWHGPYSTFMRWRKELCKAACLPPLDLMEGFFSPAHVLNNPFYFCKGLNETERYGVEQIVAQLPIKWECLKPDALHELLNHSDCDGELPWQSCAAIADSLEKLLPKLPDGSAGGHIGDWREKTQQFIAGLRDAAAKQENVDFH